MGVLLPFDRPSPSRPAATQKPCKSIGDGSPSTSSSSLELAPGQKGSARFGSAVSDASFSSARSAEGRGSPDSQGWQPRESLNSICVEANDARSADLNYFHSMANFEGMDGSFAKVRCLSDACRGQGKVELHRWSRDHQEDLSVVVKRVPTERVHINVGNVGDDRAFHRGGADHAGNRDSEDTMAEIGIYCLLAKQSDSPQYLLKMYGVFMNDDSVWIVLEHAEGGDLFTRIAQEDCGPTNTIQERSSWIKQLLIAVKYLHDHGISHRDISVENVLLHDNTVRLMDFGQSVRTHSASGVELRYFRQAGKPYYRPPECYVPVASQAEVTAPCDSKPGDICFLLTSGHLCEVRLPMDSVVGDSCVAEPCGYTTKPVDIFACGVCFFIVATGMPPWREARLTDTHFAWTHTNGIAALLSAWRKALPQEAKDLLAAVLNSNPCKRPSAEACLAHPWLRPLKPDHMPTHAALLDSRVHAETAASNEVASKEAASRPAGASDEEEVDVVAEACATMHLMAEGGVVADSWDHACAMNTRGDNDFAYGDAYCMPEVHRGLFSDASPDASFLQVQGNLLGDPYGADLLGPEGADLGFISLTRFSSADVPPCAPADPAYKMEPNTFFFAGRGPADVGNHLLNFLTTSGGASVVKLDKGKFAVTLDADGPSSSCRLKLRFFGLRGKGHAVELQRRGGSSVAFNGVCKLVRRELMAFLSETPTPPSSACAASRPQEPETMLPSFPEPGVKGLLAWTRTQRKAAGASPSASLTPMSAASPSSAASTSASSCGESAGASVPALRKEVRKRWSLQPLDMRKTSMPAVFTR